MSVLSDEQKWQLWDEVSHPSACLDAIILAYGNAVADAAIAADRALASAMADTKPQVPSDG